MMRLKGWRGNESLEGRVDSALIKLYDKTPELKEIIQQEPIYACIEELSTYNSNLGYAQLKSRLERLEGELSAQFGERLAMRYGLAILAEIIREYEDRWQAMALDPELKPEFIDSFHRILTAVSRGGNEVLSLRKDAYAKELAICLYHLIPAGGQLIDPGSGISRQIFLGAPFGDKLTVLFRVLYKSGGFSPFAEFHTNLFMRHWFTREGWEYSFRLMPAVFNSYPALRGLVGGSWFFDPVLREISPELNFIREVSLDWGARFVAGEKVKEPEGALFTSKHRRKLFDSGLYWPRSYTMIVPKKDILVRF